MKTTESNENVDAYLNSIDAEQQCIDSFVLLDIMNEVTGEEYEILE